MSHRQRPILNAAACASALLLALTACGSGESAGSASPSASSPAPPSASSVTAAPSASAGAASSPAQTPASTVPASPSASESTPPAPAVAAAPTYRMNKAYNIVPIDKDKSPSKVVLLTFDDGPKEAGMLGQILDALDKHHAKAIFFVNGYRVKAHPELLKEIDRRGQVIGNHSYDHIMLGKEKDDKIRDQIGRVQEIVKEVTGKTPVFFRPPYASANDTVHKVAKDNGLLFMTWSNGSLDWALGKKVQDKPQAVIDNVIKQLHPGSNILMHELPWTAEALDRLLTRLEDEGYAFVDPNAIDSTIGK
ncbi:polysaccharide deacetylase family protein [Cohnella sp. CFH 77786]|uniref:polysaccharide deacetylase family protein n=1 Tax=Cohnella sp. CFH 77786 TaxID=2662265 RepID=UPI001C6107C2|nr:polysaccharide deacetylase family protein [Cohnella sp. CFH 77786]MBW5446672.1 polysaccharide deacetylase family protein [Cohnella sp. CFH 77786]